MNDKKYYWLKLQKDFFKRHDIQIIEAMPNGKDYILFYLKMLVESVSHEGNLRFNDTIPYSESMLSVITNTNIDIVRSAMKVFTELGMIGICADDTIFMAEVNKMLGHETHWAEKKRSQRKVSPKIAQKPTSNELGQCPHDVQSVQPMSKQEIELEKELELDIDLEKEIDKHKEGGLPLQVKIKNVKNAKTEYFLDLLPSDSAQDFINAWLEWVDYRKEIKKKIVVSTAKKQISFLSRQKEPIACINQSIEKGWEGLFEINSGLIKKLKNYDFQKGDGDGFKVIQ